MLAGEGYSRVVLVLGLVPLSLYGQDIPSQFPDYAPASGSVSLALERPQNSQQLGVPCTDETVAFGGEYLSEAVCVSGFVEVMDVFYPLCSNAVSGSVPDCCVGMELLAQRLVHGSG